MPYDGKTLDPRQLFASRQETATRDILLTIGWHHDPERVGDQISVGMRLQLERSAPLFVGSGRPLDDPFVSRKPLVVRRRPDGGVTLTPGGSELTLDGEPVEGDETLSRQRLEEGVVLLVASRVMLVLHLGPGPQHVEREPADDMLGVSGVLAELREEIARAGKVNVPVLIVGESGTGKELVARALHEASRRRDQPYVALNMATLPAPTAASELFGHVRGAFTGAGEAQPGLFVGADGGTLFLDEVGEMPSELQAMMLRVLEGGDVRPVGGSQIRNVDVRVIAATDADLEQLVERGAFRRPLLHRLQGFVVRVPPLRLRREDVGLLLQHFLRAELAALETPEDRLSTEADQPMWLDATLSAELARASWPGNVRQLRNLARRIALSAHDQPAVSRDILAEVLDLDHEVPPSEDAAPSSQPPNSSSLTEEDIMAALEASAYSVHAAARRLGVPKSSLYKLIDRSEHLRKGKDIPADEIRTSFERHSGDVAAMVADLRVSAKAVRSRLKELGLEA